MMKKIIIITLAAMLLLLPGCSVLDTVARKLNSIIPLVSESVQPAATPNTEPTATPTPTSTPTPSPTPTSMPTLTLRPLPTLKPLPTPKPTKDPVIDVAKGKFSSNTYTSSYFKMTMTVPKAWVIAPAALLDQMQQGIVNTNNSMKDNLSVCFMVVNAHLKSGSISSLALACIDVSKSVKNGNQDDLMKEIVGKTTSVKLNGTLFGKMEASLTMGEKKTTQTFYLTVKNGYALMFMLTSDNKNDAALLLKAMKTVKFK